MGARGPKPGTGGRPRIASGKPRADGYLRTTVGPAGRGKQVYKHRAAVGLGSTPGSKAKGTVVDHEDRNRGDNRRSNLRITTKKGNASNRG